MIFAAPLKADRNECNKKALQALSRWVPVGLVGSLTISCDPHLTSLSSRAHSLDPQDAEVATYLALQLALVRQV